jgi:hypothetical protein
MRTAIASLRDWLASFITWAGTHVTEMEALQTDVANKQSQAATSATNAATSETNAATSETNAAASATSAATSATSAVSASATTGAYPNSAQSNVPRGLTQASVGAITGGSGGTNGTFALAWSGGNFTVNPTGTFTVSGGAVTAVTITGPGLYIGASTTVPTPSFAASAGLTGASVALTAQFLVASGAAYWTASADGLSLVNYRNVGGVPTDNSANVPPIPMYSAVAELRATPVPGVEHAIHDSNDNASEYIEPSTGKRYMLAVDANSVNGIPRTVLSRAVHKAANLGATYIGIPVYGQSKAIGNGGSVHTLPASFGYAQDADGFFDCKMFSANGTATAGPRAQEGSGTAAQNHDSLIAYEERPTSGSSPSGNFETPLGNCMRMVKRLMRDELGITSSNSTHIFIGSAPGQSNTTLAGLSRGTVPYNNLLADITYGKQLANAAGGSYTVKAIVLFHGDADDTAGTSRATYTTTLQTLQANLTTDINLITGDTDDIYLILSQFSSMSQLSPTIALAQRDAAMAANSKIILAGCEYASEHAASNNVHFSGIGYAHQGAYAGLAYERVIVERQTWVNAIPTVKRYGAFLRVTYPDTGYPWTSSTTLFPSVANLGFTVVNTDKVTDNPIVGVTQVGPRDFDVHITNQVAGYLRYGFSSWGGNIHDTCDIDPGTAREVTLYRPASICEEQFL